MSLRGLKVVTGKEMARVESIAYEEGFQEEDFLLNAGHKVGKGIESFAKRSKSITLLCGKGNNAGDAYVAGLYLLERGFSVHSFQLFDFDDCSELCKKYGKLFLEKGGVVQFPKNASDIIFEKHTIIVDGLLGTGFKGELRPPFLEVVEKANASQRPILSVDIPSGLDANTGSVQTSAIRASQTLFLGLPKYGFFIRDGFNHVGLLRYGNFGLEEKYIEQAEGKAYLVDESKIKEALPPILRTRHKYQAGYVLGIGASKGMGGALKLGGSGALRTGAGIVRLFYSQDAAEEMENASLELLRDVWSEERVKEALERAKAIFLGPGIGRTKQASEIVKKTIALITVPCVIDADGLYFLSEHTIKFPKQTVLTPHLQEMKRLIPNAPEDPVLFHQHVQKYVDENDVVVVLKGAPTFVFSPNFLPFLSYRGDPGMATAGTGDVLTGVIAALLAQGLDALSAAILGVYIHGIAGEEAARKKTSYGVIASDVLEQIPTAMKRMVKGLTSFEIR